MQPIAVLLSSRTLVNALSFPELYGNTGGIAVKRADSVGYALTFGVPYGTPYTLGAPTVLKFGAKVQGNDGGSYVVSNFDPEDGLFDFTIGSGPTYIVSPSWNTTKLNNMLGYGPDGFQEVSEIRTIPDFDGDLNGTFLVLHDLLGTVGVWINLNDGATTIPSGAAACARAIEITTIDTNDTAGTIATKLATALSLDAQYVAVASGDLVTVTDNVIGARSAPAADGDTGFSLDRWIQGAAPNALPPVPSVTLDGEIQWTENGQQSSSVTFPVIVSFAVNNGGEGVPAVATPAYPAPGALALRPTFQTAISITSAVTENLFTAPGSTVVAFSMLLAEIDAAAGSGAYTGAFSLPDTNLNAGALIKLSVNLAASANPTVTISDGGGTLLATITNPAPAAAAYWYGEFKFDGTAWHKTFSLFQ